MKHAVTGARARILVNGQPVSMMSNGISYSMLSEFDIKFSNKYAIRAEAMSKRFAWDTNSEIEGYGSIHRLCELLWKLGVIRL